MSAPAELGYQRAYTSAKAAVVHLLPHYASLNAADPALCGREPNWNRAYGYGWHGSGSQEELDRLDRLPLCLTCQRLIRRPEGTYQP